MGRRMNNEQPLRYKIILDDVYPHCLAFNLTEEQCKEQIIFFRNKYPGMDIRVFTVDGDSIYW